MNNLLALPLLLSCLLAPSIAQDPRPDTRDAIFERAVSGFAFDIYKRVAGDSENTLCSPFSIHVALLMTMEAMDEASAAEMARVLHSPVDAKEMGRAARALLARLGAGGPAVRLKMTNGLWKQAGGSFPERLADVLSAQYGAEVSDVDFAGDPGAARRAINEAIAAATAGRIRDLLTASDLSPAPMAVLTNAMWLKARWGIKFSKSQTRDRPFTLGDGTTVNVPLMRNASVRRYYEDDQAQVVELAYAGGHLSMIVVLPRNGKSLTELERGLSSETWGRWINGLSAQRVDVLLPRFRAEQRLELQGHLAAMGMSRLFDAGVAAAAGGAVGEPRFFADRVIHKTWIQVDEDGTEAAAATAVRLREGAIARPPQAGVSFMADRPFLFAIQATGSSAPIFLGRICDPR